jgi:hypothetical protein
MNKEHRKNGALLRESQIILLEIKGFLAPLRMS